uniref:Transmembrane protein n=1 Tax=Medicago truncatula TaxID=3880 RepID=I3SU36_MEDTR|nr:unknown [Medicago truncatula]
MRSNSKTKCISPISRFSTKQEYIRVIHNFFVQIPRIKIFSYISILFVKLTNSINHFIQDINGNFMINYLKKSPLMACTLNLANYLYTSSWIVVYVFEVYDGNTQLGLTS